jgi:hypothetical protein
MYQGKDGKNIIVHLKKVELVGVKSVKTEHIE